MMEENERKSWLDGNCLWMCGERKISDDKSGYFAVQYEF